MKKTLKPLHIISTVARSATLLGTCVSGINAVTATQFTDDDSFLMDVMDGSGSGSVGSPSSGTISISMIPGGVASSVNVVITLTCATSTDNYSCVGAMLTGSSIVQQFSFQNNCGTTLTTTYSNLPCTALQIYHVNFLCIDNNTKVAFFNQSTNASFQCA